MDIGHPTKNKKQERDEYCRTVDTLLKIKKQDRDEYCWTLDSGHPTKNKKNKTGLILFDTLLKIEARYRLTRNLPFMCVNKIKRIFM